jgi:hypothetical protein
VCQSGRTCPLSEVMCVHVCRVGMCVCCCVMHCMNKANKAVKWGMSLAAMNMQQGNGAAWVAHRWRVAHVDHREPRVVATGLPHDTLKGCVERLVCNGGVCVYMPFENNCTPLHAVHQWSLQSPNAFARTCAPLSEGSESGKCGIGTCDGFPQPRACPVRVHTTPAT